MKENCEICEGYGWEDCWVCRGSGEGPADGTLCDLCRGTGRIRCECVENDEEFEE